MNEALGKSSNKLNSPLKFRFRRKEWNWHPMRHVLIAGPDGSVLRAGSRDDGRPPHWGDELLLPSSPGAMDWISSAASSCHEIPHQRHVTHPLLERPTGSGRPVSAWPNDNSFLDTYKSRTKLSCHRGQHNPSPKSKSPYQRRDWFLFMIEYRTFRWRSSDGIKLPTGMPWGYRESRMYSDIDVIHRICVIT